MENTEEEAQANLMAYQANLMAYQNDPLKIEGTISTGYPGDGSLITQKYSPLDSNSIKINKGTAFMEKRDIGLKRLTNFTNPMEIQYYVNGNMYGRFCDMWRTPEVYNSSIMSVVSCGRSQYICEPLRLLYEKNKTDWKYNKELVNKTDWRIKECLLPWYAPARTNRPLIIFVPEEEYKDYTGALNIKDFGSLPPLLVVGWKVLCKESDWIGFGCSRFAALRFMKFDFFSTLKTLWMVDDNVFDVDNGGADLTPYEEHIVRKKLGICGFKGASRIEKSSFQDICKSLTTDVTREIRDPSIMDPEMKIAQQVVILNLPLLKDKKLNYSPLFCFSGEDVSFSSFLSKTCLDDKYSNGPYLFQGVWLPKVIKYNPTIFNDGSESSPSSYSDKMDKLCKDLFVCDGGLSVSHTYLDSNPNIWNNKETFKKYYGHELAPFYKSKVHAFEQCMVQEVKKMNKEALKLYFSDAKWSYNFIWDK